MDDRQTDDRGGASADFLLAEYQSYMASYWRSEELGERRVNFLLTVTTAVAGALAIREEGIPAPGGSAYPIFLYALGAMVLFGLVTLVRIIRRNLNSHEYLRAAARVRRYFADRDEGILQYLYYKPFDDRPQRKKEWNQLFSLRTGGLAETVALVNGLIFAALCALFVLSYPAWVSGLAGVAGFVAAWILQFVYVKHRYDKGRPTADEIEFPEIEAALIIRSENPQAVASQIAGLTSIAGYRLMPQDSEAIHDLYLDTPDRVLSAQYLALRVREMGGSRWITLKGESQPTDWGGVERLEIEAPWSEEALARVIRELAERKIRVPAQRQVFDDASPMDVMAGLGLEVVQERGNQREVRNVMRMGAEAGPTLAELAVDSVVYRLGARAVRHHEVEIEAKVRDGGAVLRDVIESLVAMFGPALRRWDHSKLATGKAIEKLLSAGALEGLLDSNGNLEPVAYDRIDRYLRRGSI